MQRTENGYMNDKTEYETTLSFHDKANAL